MFNLQNPLQFINVIGAVRVYQCFDDHGDDIAILY